MSDEVKIGARIGHAGRVTDMGKMADFTLSIQFAREILAALREAGISDETIFQGGDLSAELLADPSGRISATSFRGLAYRAAQLLDDEFYGLDSRRMKIGSRRLLCETATLSATLGQAVKRMAAFFNILFDDFHCELSVEGEIFRFAIYERPGPRSPRTLAHEYLLTTVYGLACWLTGRRVPLIASTFAFTDSGKADDYRALFDTDLWFDQEVTSISLRQSYLDLPVIRDELDVDEFMEDIGSNLIRRYRTSKGLAAHIRRRLRKQPCADWPDFDKVSEDLRMTPSTLRRRLSEEGQSFSLIKDQIRKSIAIEYLKAPQSSVWQIAANLGFSEPSAFYKAFRNWTGVSVAEYRQRYQSQESDSVTGS